MFGTQDFFVFLVAGLSLNLTPGPDTLYIVGRSLAEGPRAGVLSALGVSSGALLHTAAAAFGLSAVLAASATLFGAVKWAGAAYLVYLGVRFLRAPTSCAQWGAGPPGGSGAWRVYRQGVLTNLLNPKVALFFLAFLPQFVAPERAQSPWPYLFLGAVFVTTGTLWCLVLALAAGTASRALRPSAPATTLARRLAGAVFLGLGIRMATQASR